MTIAVETTATTQGQGKGAAAVAATAARVRSTTRAATVRAGKATRARAWAATCRLGRGLVNAPGDFWRWYGAYEQVPAIEAATGDGKVKAIFQRRQTIKEHRATVASALLPALGWSLGWWWPVALAVLPVAVLLLFAWWGRKAPGAWAARWTLAFLAAAGACWLHLLRGLPWWLFPGSVVALALLLLFVAAGDGDITNDLDHVKEGKRADLTDGQVAQAVAAAVKIKPVEIKDRVKVIGGGLAWDARHRWQTITLETLNKTFDDVAAARTAVAGGLRVPAAWLMVEEGANAAQTVLSIARRDPWPKEPSPWPLLDQLVHDVFAPAEIGLDLVGTDPVCLLLAQSSILVAGSPGGGKTALLRQLAKLVGGDPAAGLDIWDLKGDGGLKAFEPLCTTYRAGDEDEDIAALARFLDEACDDLRRRKRVLASLPAEDAPDAKVTRELAHRHDLGLPLRVIIVDEVQDGIGHPIYGELIVAGLRYLAKQGRSAGVRLVLATQKPDAASIPTSIRSVLPTRICLRVDDRSSSEMVLGQGAGVPRADLLPPVEGAAIIKGAGDGAGALRGFAKVRLHYVSGTDAAAAVARLVARRKAAGTLPGLPEAPPFLVAMRDLLAEPARHGRMRSSDVAAALAELGHLPAGLDEHQRRVQLAALARPLGVRTHPDRGRRNRMSYWLMGPSPKVARIGVETALERFAPVPVGASLGASDGAPEGAPAGGPVLSLVSPR